MVGGVGGQQERQKLEIGATFADALVHEEGALCAVGQLVEGSPCMFVNELGVM